MTELEKWLEQIKLLSNSDDGPTFIEVGQAIAVIEKLKGVIYHVAKKEHKPWLKKCLEDALAIDPEKL